jgi:signal recognition particle subunit SEC65
MSLAGDIFKRILENTVIWTYYISQVLERRSLRQMNLETVKWLVLHLVFKFKKLHLLRPLQSWLFYFTLLDPQKRRKLFKDIISARVSSLSTLVKALKETSKASFVVKSSDFQYPIDNQETRMIVENQTTFTETLTQDINAPERNPFCSETKIESLISTFTTEDIPTTECITSRSTGSNHTSESISTTETILSSGSISTTETILSSGSISTTETIISSGSSLTSEQIPTTEPILKSKESEPILTIETTKTWDQIQSISFDIPVYTTETLSSLRNTVTLQSEIAKQSRYTENAFVIAVSACGIAIVFVLFVLVVLVVRRIRKSNSKIPPLII